MIEISSRPYVPNDFEDVHARKSSYQLAQHAVRSRKHSMLTAADGVLAPVTRRE